MNAPLGLAGAHLRTFQRIFQHPVSHNLGWLDVHALFRQIGKVVEEPNGHLKVTRNGQVLILPAPRTKDVGETEEIMKIRSFIERTEPSAPGARAATSPASHWLVIVDHHEVRIFRSESPGAVAQEILPHEPDDYFKHAHHSASFARGQEKPDPNSFFEPVAAALNEAGKILVFGNGTGMASEMEQFVAWLKTHHPLLADRIVATQAIDEHHLTDAQLLAKARDYCVRKLPAAPDAS